MRRMVLLLLLVPVLGAAQVKFTLGTATNYYNGTTTDTSYVFALGDGNLVLAVSATDTFNFAVDVDYRTAGHGTKWATYAAKDSTNSGAGGYYGGFVLRAAGTNNVPGNIARVRLTQKVALLNNDSTATFMVQLIKQ